MLGTATTQCESRHSCARAIAAGWKIVHDVRFRVWHEKTRHGRDFAQIIARLVRNNGWVVARYAPAPRRETRRAEILERYAVIARREGVVAGFEQGRRALEATVAGQPRRPLAPALDARFTGVAHVERELARHEPRIAGRGE